MNAFVSSLAAILQADRLGLDDDFRRAADWAPPREREVQALLAGTWGVVLTESRLRELVTVRDLFREAFLVLAAAVFKVPRATLSGETAYRSIAAWDSVAHLKLTMEAEHRFGVSYPLERIPFLLRLEDFLVA